MSIPESFYNFMVKQK